MKITFIGTSYSRPKNRKCSCTLIEIEGNHYIVDMGTDATEDLYAMGIPMDSIKGIFLSHMHGDHVNGIVSFIDLGNWSHRISDPKIFLPEKKEPIIAALNQWLLCLGNTAPRDYDFNDIEAGEIYKDEKVTVTAFRTKHTANSYAFLFETKDKRALFCSDSSLKGPQDDFPVETLSKPLDLCVVEGAHFSPFEYVPLFENTENLKCLCFTHYIDENVSDILSLQETFKKFPVICAVDNFKLEI